MKTRQTLPSCLTSTLPTGRWLAKEREQLSLTSPQLARALGQHPSTVASVERQNYVVPPGWYGTLYLLDISIPDLQWPARMEPYFGWQLKEEMEVKRHLHLSPFWLRRKLAVPEQELTSVLNGNRLVPRSWLLKLAELGLDVPREVKRVLQAAAVRTLSALEASGLAQERPELRLQWSPESGFDLFVSESLLNTLPGAVQQLIGLLPPAIGRPGRVVRLSGQTRDPVDVP